MSKLKYEPGERIFPRLADIESETYLEYYEDESQTKDDLKKSLESKKGEVIKMVEELRKMGISYDKILSKIKSLGKNHSTNVWYFGQPAPDAPTGHGSGYYEGDDERKIKKHENCSWTLDIIKDMKNINKVQSLYRGKKSRNTTKSKGLMTVKQKKMLWPQIKQSLIDDFIETLDEDMSEEEKKKAILNFEEEIYDSFYLKNFKNQIKEQIRDTKHKTKDYPHISAPSISKKGKKGSSKKRKRRSRRKGKKSSKKNNIKK